MKLLQLLGKAATQVAVSRLLGATAPDADPNDPIASSLANELVNQAFHTIAPHVVMNNVHPMDVRNIALGAAIALATNQGHT